MVFPFVHKHEHISPLLNKLYWLPIEQRIVFKIAFLTFKTLHNNAPSHLCDLLIPQKSSRTTRFSDRPLLTIPNITSSAGRPFLSVLLLFETLSLSRYYQKLLLLLFALS